MYLLSRMAAAALKLETIHADIPAGEMLAALNEEAGVLDVAILDTPKDLAQDTLADLELGRELFRIGTAEVRSSRVCAFSFSHRLEDGDAV